MSGLRSLICIISVAAAIVSVGRAEPGPDFQREIRPILSNLCFKCHGPDEQERKGGKEGSGGLRLDSEEGSRADLGGAAAVVPGHPDASALIARITTADRDEMMPPPKSGKKLTPHEIDLLTAWIKGGGKYAKHWAYEAPRRSTPPHAAENPIDGFIRARLETEGLAPQPEADRATLIRRASLDLTGLPPTVSEVDAFVNDTAPDAYGRLIDRLLAAPAYGEHWARQWLDLARYADSAGYADDPPRSIWGYRDYVIRAFNANKPFDQFTIEQLAGDLLPNPTDDQLMATAFHRNTMTNSEGGTQDEEFRNAAIVDRVNTTMAVWMGTSMACAQCHTHKYDPITNAEYFRVFAFLNNTQDADRFDETPVLSFFDDAKREQRGRLEADLAAIEARFAHPAPEQVAAAGQWAAEFPASMTWQVLTPTSLRSQGGLAMARQPDGSVLVGATAAKDTYTLDVPVAAARQITALRLDALPHDSLPGRGPGHANGNFVITRVRATVAPPADTPRPRARFVRIELPGPGKMLQLAEVQVFSGGVNVAPKGVATQKSTYGDAGATRAIDGNTAGEYTKGSVAHTADGTDDPWWEVDLQAEQPIDRIVVWNRAEAGERLAGFRIAGLDEKRRTVWEKAGNPAPPADLAFDVGGGREIAFSGAIADFVQPDFDEDGVLTDAAPKGNRKGKKRGPQQGWAIGGSSATSHSLTLVTPEPVAVPAGATLTISLEQQSGFANHTLGHFRLSATDDPRVSRQVGTPGDVLALLTIPTAQRDDAQRARIVDHYVRDVSPELGPDRDRAIALRKQIAEMAPATVPIFRELEAGQRRKTRIQLRGNYLSLGEEVTEGVPAAFHPLPSGAPLNRLTLARWLVDDANPLTPRVIANRYWEAIFGTGLVRTSEEFGAQGELPSHPELLDWLATELVRLKWDTKKLLRLLVTSATYRQSSKVSADLAERDPENRLLARGPRVRLSAEMVRDQAQAVSGMLSPKMYGPSVRPVRPSLGLSAAFGGGLDWQPSAGEDAHRRALYTEWRRTSPYPSMATFDAPNREVCTLRRNRTNTPLQALVLMNDPVYIEASQALARIMVASASTPAGAVGEGFRRVLSRPPSERELHRLIALHDDTLATFKQDEKRAVEVATNPIGPVPPNTEVAEMAAWTTVAGVLLNLDETLMKR